jgi:transcriptional regulator with XRE-family HTH domain
MSDPGNIFDQDLGFWFWKRVDGLRGKRQLKEIAEAAEIDYTRIKNQRSDNRTPKLEDAYRLSRVLGCSLSFLITGVESDNIIPGNLLPIINALKTASEEDIHIVRRILRIPEDSALSVRNA